MPLTVRCSFLDLPPHLAHAVWRLRQEVFVVEQDCPYPDLDGRDVEPGTVHVLLLAEPPTDLSDPASADRLRGYARVLDDGDSWRIGRVVLAPTARGQGLADVVMRAAVECCPGRRIELSAQAPLARWYATHGFAVCGPGYDEDGIAHLPMRREAG